MGTETVPGSPSIGDAFRHLNFLADAVITASSATSPSRVTGNETFTVSGSGLTLTDIGGKDCFSTGTVNGTAMAIGGTTYLGVRNMVISANLFRNSIIAEDDNTNISALANLFHWRSYEIFGTTGADFQSVAQFSTDGTGLMTRGDSNHHLSSGDDSIAAGRGNDTIQAEAGAESITSGIGDDNVRGGSGADRPGWGGADFMMMGETNGDFFVFGALADLTIGAGTRGHIGDFATGSDKLNFRGLGLTFVTGAFACANQVRFDALSHSEQINTDANLAADFEIELQNGANVVAGDLILV